MKRILLSRGMEALVDDEDFARVMKLPWHAWHRQGRGSYVWYAWASNPANWRGAKISMHRFVLGLKPGDPMVDHINGNGLDNRRANLRVASGSLNQHNGRLPKHNKSGYRGVHWAKSAHKWCAEIGLHKKITTLGYFNTKEEAAAIVVAARAKIIAHLIATGP